MTLIEVFTDFIRNKKSLKEYVEVRKTMDSRGEFNDKRLLEAQEYLDRLKVDEPEIYDLMYETLERYFEEIMGILWSILSILFVRFLKFIAIIFLLKRSMSVM